jgi:hypothetical protein
MASLPKTLKNLWANNRDKINEIVDERSSGDGYWIYLTPGWLCGDLECHFCHEWTVADVLEAFRSVHACDCEECQAALSEPAQEDKHDYYDQVCGPDADRKDWVVTKMRG